MWLIDRLTAAFTNGASERGKASCEAEFSTGRIGERRSRERAAGSKFPIFALRGPD